MKATLLVDSYSKGNKLLPKGTVIDHPDCWKLVRNGHAASADDDCKNKAKAGDGHRRHPMTDDDISKAQEHFAKLSRGQATGVKRFDAPNKGETLDEPNKP
jgi:hypothetical protein